MNLALIIQTISVAIIPLLFAITVHEAAHGYVASKLGDQTAVLMGRVTLNPIKHIDLIGTILVPLATLFLGAVFGWAKPVPITWQNLRNPRRDRMLVALAGPAANLAMALLWGVYLKLLLLIQPNAFSSSSPILQFLSLTGRIGVWTNTILMLLNLLPIPPLDGSRVVSSLLSRRLSYYYDKIEPYGLFILLGLLFIGAFHLLLWPGTVAVTGIIEGLLQIPPVDGPM